MEVCQTAFHKSTCEIFIVLSSKLFAYNFFSCISYALERSRGVKGD